MDFEKRLKRVEKEARVLRGLLIALVVLLIGGFWISDLSSQAAEDEIADVVRARQFELIGPSGKVVAELENSGSGGLLTFYDSKGEHTLVLGGTGKPGGFLSTFTGKGNQLVAIGMSEGGHGIVITYNQKGGLSAVLGEEAATCSIGHACYWRMVVDSRDILDDPMRNIACRSSSRCFNAGCYKKRVHTTEYVGRGCRHWSGERR